MTARPQRIANMITLPCIRVLRMDAGWGVAESPDGECLARFEAREDAVDYARLIAIDNPESILEAEDELGTLTLRQQLSTDAMGVIRLRPINN